MYDEDPAKLAAEWSGVVPLLHVVDLEGARAGRAVQRDVVSRIAEAFAGSLQVGGGVRTEEALLSYLEIGAERIVLGTAAIRDPDLVARLALAHPGRIVIALDAREGRVAIDGWERESERTALDLAERSTSYPWARFSTPTSSATARRWDRTWSTPRDWPKRRGIP